MLNNIRFFLACFVLQMKSIFFTWSIVMFKLKFLHCKFDVFGGVQKNSGKPKITILIQCPIDGLHHVQIVPLAGC